MSAYHPMKHQSMTLARMAKSPIIFDMSDPGCVSADTEFLSATGWKRIDQYKPGDLVGQFYPDSREVELVEPLQYVKRPCARMIAIAPARGMSQRLSHEHRVLYYRPDGTHDVCSAQEFMEGLHELGPNRFQRKFCSTFSVRAVGIDLIDSYIRVMVAVIADGSFQSNSTRCVIRIKKARKIERLRRILAEAQIEADEITCGGQPDFRVFKFYAPLRMKEFGTYWWGASQAQLELIADELPHWDSNIGARPNSATRFSSFIEDSANFAQYAFAAAKRPTSLQVSYRDRIKEGRGVMVEYVATAQIEDKLIGPGRVGSVFEVPNHEGFKYCFEVPTSFLLLRHNGYIFATGNTGKTGVQVWAFAARRKKKGGAALVMAPKSLLRSAWEDDFGKFAPHLKCSVAYAEVREKAFLQEADVYITNIDAAVWLLKQKPAFFKRFDTLIIDEVSACKHHTSARSKAVNKIKKYFKYRSVMSGTPNSNTILDIWNPVQILDDGKRLGTQFFGFRSAVCTPTQVGPKANMLDWTDKEGAEETVFSLIADISVRHRKEDCLDIPPTQLYTVQYHLSDRQKKAYDEMAETQIMSLFDKKDIPAVMAARMAGKPFDHLLTAKVSAINAAAVRTKLLQIASGAVYENPGSYHVVDTGRYELVMDLVEERKHPLVFFMWKHQRDQLIEQAKKRGHKYCVLDGTTSASAKNDMVKAYQAGFYDEMFAHPKSAAHGLTLTRGTSTIWTGPPDDLEWFVQGNQRQARQGQKEKTEVIVVLSPGTVETRVYKRLMDKDAKMSNLLDLFSGV